MSYFPVGNFALEICNAPGNAASINLAGAPPGRVPLNIAIPSGSTICYVMDDGAQQEVGVGAFTAGSPNTISRDTPLWTSSLGYSSPARLAFAGQVRVYTMIPAEKVIAADLAGNVSLPNHATAAAHAVRLDDLDTGANANGVWEKRPNGRAVQYGQGLTTAGGGCNVAFPRDDLGEPGCIICTLTGQPGPQHATVAVGTTINADGFTAIVTNSSGSGVSGAAFFWEARF